MTTNSQTLLRTHTIMAAKMLIPGITVVFTPYAADKVLKC